MSQNKSQKQVIRIQKYPSLTKVKLTICGANKKLSDIQRSREILLTMKWKISPSVSSQTEADAWITAQTSFWVTHRVKEEVTKETRQYKELNENEYYAYQNLKKAAKAGVYGNLRHQLSL